jgi:hypothetical protein
MSRGGIDRFFGIAPELPEPCDECGEALCECPTCERLDTHTRGSHAMCPSCAYVEGAAALAGGIALGEWARRTANEMRLRPLYRNECVECATWVEHDSPYVDTCRACSKLREIPEETNAE